MTQLRARIETITLKDRVMTIDLILSNGIHLIFSLIFRPVSQRPGDWNILLLIEQLFGEKNRYPLGEYLFDSRGTLTKLVLPDFDMESTDSANYSLLDPRTRTVTDPDKIREYLDRNQDQYLMQVFPVCLDALRQNRGQAVREFKKQFALHDAYHQQQSEQRSRIMDQTIKRKDLEDFLLFEYIIGHREEFFRL